MSYRVIPSDFVRSVLHNGVGRHVCQLQRLTLSFCKSNAGSRGMRDFIENHLLDFTRENPGIVVYIKPRRFRSALLRGEYLNQQAVSLPMNNLSDAEICQWVEHLRTRSGHQIVRLQKTWHTDSPSIQGIWTPFTNKDTSINMEEFPSKRLGSFKYKEKSATESILEMVEKQELKSVVVDNKGGEKLSRKK